MQPYRNSDPAFGGTSFPTSRRMSVLIPPYGGTAAASSALSIATLGLVLVRLDASLPIAPAACRETIEPSDGDRVKCADGARLEVLSTKDRWDHPMVACRCPLDAIPPLGGTDAGEAGR